MNDAQTADRDLSAPSILVVGDLQMRRAVLPLPEMADIAFCDARDLKKHLKKNATDIVISLLIDGDFDAMEIARCLERLRFKGRYRILCQPVACQTIILSELCEAAPHVDVDFLIIE